MALGFASSPKKSSQNPPMLIRITKIKKTISIL
jgi:hypothetical protein